MITPKKKRKPDGFDREIQYSEKSKSPDEDPGLELMIGTWFAMAIAIVILSRDRAGALEEIVAQLEDAEQASSKKRGRHVSLRAVRSLVQIFSELTDFAG